MRLIDADKLKREDLCDIHALGQCTMQKKHGYS